MLRRISRHFLILIFFSANLLHAHAQCNDWERLIAYPGLNLHGTVRDRYGNIFSAGRALDAVTIGEISIPAAPDDLHSAILLKMDKDFNILWIKRTGGAAVYNIAFDHKDNVITAGFFIGPQETFGCVTFTGSPDFTQGFVLKMTSSGFPIWGVQTEGELSEHISNIAVTATNDIIATGAFEGENVSVQGKPLHFFGSHDPFIVSISENGVVDWAFSMGVEEETHIDNGLDYILDLKIDRGGDILIGGEFGTSIFHIRNTTVLPKENAVLNWFIAKLDKHGNLIWVKSDRLENNITSLSFMAPDNQNNIYFAGDFSEPMVFDSFTLTTSGLTDIFLLKIDPDGNILSGTTFGGESWDQLSYLSIDINNNLLMGGGYMSPSFSFGQFTTSGTTSKDVFIGTIDTDLNPICMNSTTGDAFKTLSMLSVDSINNAIAIAWTFDRTVNLGNKFSYTVSDGKNPLILIGNHAPYRQQKEAQSILDLGPDVAICGPDAITLSSGTSFCNAVYRWSNGHTGSSLTVNQPGTYWLDVEVFGTKFRDSVVVSLKNPVQPPDLGPDKTICPGELTTFDVSQPGSVLYLWNDGMVSPERIISSPGQYSVLIYSECASASDNITISMHEPLPYVDLGDDATICLGESVVLQVPANLQAEYEWSDGSNGPSLKIGETGTYGLTVFNACESKTYSIQVETVGGDDLVLPNIVTRDGNNKNDTFILPDFLDGASISIYNRWGELVFNSGDYKNKWDGGGLPVGTYFYILTGNCLTQPLKGTVHLIGE